MRISRPCYDKPHRCPGQKGGGPKYAKVLLCDGGIVHYPRSMWWFGRCELCRVLVLPPKMLRWIAPSEIWWKLKSLWRVW